MATFLVLFISFMPNNISEFAPQLELLYNHHNGVNLFLFCKRKGNLMDAPDAPR